VEALPPQFQRFPARVQRRPCPPANATFVGLLGGGFALLAYGYLNGRRLVQSWLRLGILVLVAASSAAPAVAAVGISSLASAGIVIFLGHMLAFLFGAAVAAFENTADRAYGFFNGGAKAYGSAVPLGSACVAGGLVLEALLLLLAALT
jgi:hypothetical protein